MLARIAWRLLYGLPLGGVWMLLTGQLNLPGFLIGAAAGFVIMMLIGAPAGKENWHRLPVQLVTFIGYLLGLGWDIVVSSFQVMRILADPELPLRQGIIAISVQDAHRNELIAAMSAHAITITPGQLVVDFVDKDVMYVHCLDVEAAALAEEQGTQRKRARMFQRILGYE